MNKWYWGLAFVWSGMLSNVAVAACKQNTNNGLTYYIAEVSGIDPPEFDPGSVAIGGVIYDSKGTAKFTNMGGTRATVSCDPGQDSYATGDGTPNSNNIYPTSIPNIGVRLWLPSGSQAPAKVGFITSTETAWSESWVLRLQLIKTGEITAGGTLAGTYAHLRAGGADGESLVEYRFSKPVNVRPRIPTCKVATPLVTVPMGSVVKSYFTGVGSTSNANAFDILLSCSGGNPGTSTNAHVTLTDATDPKNTSTTLSLSKDSNASGIGLQVLRSGTPLGFGPDSAAVGNTNQWHAGNVKQGQATLKIPLSARYVQTAPSITPGVANARATFTLSYQ
ncbi:fimbrial protein [Burkholderia cenocepacia]|uniref:fimbrial protein n=1 Tax=Burkholderia cenocepacia TaxID=95486 RepID=UPI002AB7476B|nr:fimbrial protein [Burkholderia cenocepacia]